MAQLFLPAEHTEADLVLAGQIAELVHSGTLYVAWTPEHGRAVPVVKAELRALLPNRTGTLVLVFELARALWRVLAARDPQRHPVVPPAPADGDQAAQPKPAAGEAAA
jgi:hypothetical protein